VLPSWCRRGQAVHNQPDTPRHNQQVVIELPGESADGGREKRLCRESCVNVIGSLALWSSLAIVERARWLVMLPRTPAAGTPALRQSIRMTLLVMQGAETRRRAEGEQQVRPLAGALVGELRLAGADGLPCLDGLSRPLLISAATGGHRPPTIRLRALALAECHSSNRS
jgi:hypothetical protein